jgi:eukaryotic-like serine/threonine-protein kinase
VLLLESAENKFVTDWSKDGTTLVFASNSPDTGWDLWALPLVGERKPFPLRRTKFMELNGTISPDGRYLAFHSNESGRTEVYVQEFPAARSKWQVSPEGGREPHWSADGRELFYRAPDAKIMAVPVEKGAAFATGIPQALFQTRFAPVNARELYRPSSDGQRFLVLAPPERDAIQPATIVLNWTSALQ